MSVSLPESFETTITAFLSSLLMVARLVVAIEGTAMFEAGRLEEAKLRVVRLLALGIVRFGAVLLVALKGLRS